jgi:hypothetical protein
MRIGVISLLMMAAALPAGAQPAPAPAPRDVIADLIDRSVPPPKDEDEPDTAGQPRAAQESELDSSPLPQTGPQTGPQSGPQPGSQLPFAPAPRQQLNAPVRIEEAGKTPDAPLTVRDMTYDARIRSSFASAESFQGPLDGGWTLSAADQELYALQLVDRRDRLEGVWRDLRRRGSLNGSGLVDDLQRQGADLILRFTPSPGVETSVATLHDGGSGLWTWELAEAGRRRPVTLRRTSP